jgi:hypothetical protein
MITFETLYKWEKVRHEKSKAEEAPFHASCTPGNYKCNYRGANYRDLLGA